MERITKPGAAHDEYPIGTANGFLALVVALVLLVAGGLLLRIPFPAASAGACLPLASWC